MTTGAPVRGRPVAPAPGRPAAPAPGRPAALWLGVGAAVLVAVLLIGAPPDDGTPLDPTSTGPLGTRGLVEVLERLGADVTTVEGVPTPDTDVALLLADRLTAERRDELRAWVGAGGTLVVADPGSELVAVPVIGRLSDPRSGVTGCGIAALDGVEALQVDGVGFGVGIRDRGCLGDDDRFFVVASPLGAGTVVAVGGAGAFVNERLDDADNAVLAGALLAPTPATSVAVLVPSPAGSGTASLQDLVGDGVKQALVQLGVAFALYALWRGRRLGRPVAEAQPVELAASELVVATGHLLHQGRHHQRAAAIIREDARRRIAARLGLASTAGPATVADVAVRRGGLDRDRLAAVLAPGPVEDDEQLVALAATAHDITEELDRAR